MASEEPSGALSYKVSVLKVSIHCQGCKKKIHRILKNIHEVYKVDIDALQNKVTVIGNVDGETLVRKLAKSRKYAELLPPEEKKVVDGNGSGSKDETKEPSETEEQEKDTATSPEQKAADNAEAPALPADAAADSPKSTDEIEEKGKEQETSDDEIVEVSNPPPEKAAETEENAPATSEKAGADDNGTAGGGGKKKGKKAQKGRKGEVADTSRSVEDATDGPMRMPASTYIYPPLQQLPYYAMNYDVAEPSVRSTHYVPSVPQGSAFVDQPYPPPTEFYYGGAPLPHSKSYSMFSDEDPNSCNIM